MSCVATEEIEFVRAFVGIKHGRMAGCLERLSIDHVAMDTSSSKWEVFGKETSTVDVQCTSMTLR